jgi:hypothetical protein
MRYWALICLLAVSLAGQNPPNCTGVGLDVDIRCACVKDPNGDTCALYKRNKDMYDGKMKMPDPKDWGLTGWSNPPTTSTAPRVQQPVRQRPQQARVVPLPSTDYLRFLHPNATVAAGFDFAKILAIPEVMQSILGAPEGADAKQTQLAAFKEIDHFWMSIATGGPAPDLVILMTGKFEKGAAAGMFYSQGVMPVFLGDAHAMMIGPEHSVQAALARMARPAANEGWVARHARELAKDHETWIATEPHFSAQAGNSVPAGIQSIRKFAFGIRLTGEAAIDGEAVTDSDASAQQIAAWIDQIKSLVKEKTGVPALDPLKVSLDGATLRFTAKDDRILNGDGGKQLMNTDLGPQLYSVLMSGIPGTPARTVPEERILQIRQGMKREEVLKLLGQPLSIRAIQGLEEPRETFLYQVPFGKQYSIRLDAGVVSQPPR